MQGLFIAALLGLILSTPLPAQEEEEDPLAVEGEIGASLFFGNTEQATVTTRASLEWTGDTWLYRTGANFSYGEATGDEGVTFVSKRSWTVAASADYAGFGRLSPSGSARVESSLEKRIDLRVAGGAGAVYQAVKTDRTRVRLGLSLLAEYTEPRIEPDQELTPESETVGRWSARFLLQRDLGDGRATFTSDTSYDPELSTLGSFTLVSENSLAFRLTDVVSLKLSFLDSFDSEAEERGAETNNDGQLFFSLLSSF